MSQDSREQFEAAFIAELMRDGCPETFAKLVLERGSDGEYRSIRAAGAWWGWQASRAAVVITLPPAEDVGEISEVMMYLPDEVRAAIEAAGVKVAP